MAGVNFGGLIPAAGAAAGGFVGGAQEGQKFAYTKQLMNLQRLQDERAGKKAARVEDEAHRSDTPIESLAPGLGEGMDKANRLRPGTAGKLTVNESQRLGLGRALDPAAMERARGRAQALYVQALREIRLTAKGPVDYAQKKVDYLQKAIDSKQKLLDTGDAMDEDEVKADIKALQDKLNDANDEFEFQSKSFGNTVGGAAANVGHNTGIVGKDTTTVTPQRVKTPTGGGTPPPAAPPAQPGKVKSPVTGLQPKHKTLLDGIFNGR